MARGPGRPGLSVTISGLSRIFGHDLGALLELAGAADSLGVDQLVMPDHVVIGPNLHAYPFGTFPYPPEEPWLEPLTTLAAVAGATHHVRLSTGVLVAPLRPAVLLAKTVSTLDVLSGGRVDLGVGVGWQPEEFAALGAPFEGRGGVLEDTVAACRALWTEEPPVSFSSATVSFEDLWCEPRPVQARLPVWFGGAGSARTARRVATLGDGWLPVAGTPHAELEEGISLIRAACEEIGREPAAIGVRAGLPLAVTDAGHPELEQALAAADHLGQLGVTAVSVTAARAATTLAEAISLLEELTSAWST
jgi:probable F420-dependent oxidoreductase